MGEGSERMGMPVDSESRGIGRGPFRRLFLLELDTLAPGLGCSHCLAA